MMAWRPTSLKAICMGECSVRGGDGDARGHHLRVGDRPLQGLHAAHGAADDASSRSMPRWSISSFCARTMSATVTTGNRRPYSLARWPG